MNPCKTSVSSVGERFPRPQRGETGNCRQATTAAGEPAGSSDHRVQRKARQSPGERTSQRPAARPRGSSPPASSHQAGRPRDHTRAARRLPGAWFGRGKLRRLQDLEASHGECIAGFEWIPPPVPTESLLASAASAAARRASRVTVGRVPTEPLNTGLLELIEAEQRELERDGRQIALGAEVRRFRFVSRAEAADRAKAAERRASRRSQ